MRHRLPHYATPLAILLAIPFIYNSCQKQLLGSSLEAASASCKVTMENGSAKMVSLDPSAVPEAFQSGKVQLGGVRGPSGLSKATAAVRVAQGTSLGVMMNNQCLQQNAQSLDQTVISKAVARTGELLQGLDRQIYLWTVDQDSTDAEIEDLANQEPCVVGISWNQEYKAASITFNDSSYVNQGHLTSMHAQDAYGLFYGGVGGMAIAGQSVILATVDTGVDWTHPDLASNMWTSTSGVGIDITTLGTSNVNYNPQDVSSIGHGTHVSGIMAAVSNNQIGIVGTMPYRAKIMGVKIFEESGGTTSTTSQFFYNGIKFAYLNGANVINLSLGSMSTGAAVDTLTQSAVTEAVQHGSVVIVVIGNADGGANGQLVDGVNFSSIPGEYATIPGVIGVGSVDAQTGEKSSFSHYSPVYAEIGAPGAEIGNTGIYSTVPGGTYARLMGTSQAAPMVSAAAGLTIGLIREHYGVAPSPAEVERLILASAVKSPQLTAYFKDGNRLDLLSLVQTINKQYPLTLTGGHAQGIASVCH